MGHLRFDWLGLFSLFIDLLFCKRQYDRHAKDHPSFAVGDHVWLTRKNIKTSRPSQKLDVKRFGLFEIQEVVGESKLAFKLKLLRHMRIHSVFHISLLEPYHDNPFPGRIQLVPSLIVMNDEFEYVVNEVLDLKIERGTRVVD